MDQNSDFSKQAMVEQPALPNKPNIQEPAPISEPVAKKEKRAKINFKNKNVILFASMAVLVVICLAFSGFELWQNVKKSDENKALQARVYNLTQNKGTSKDTPTKTDEPTGNTENANIKIVIKGKIENVVRLSGEGYYDRFEYLMPRDENVDYSYSYIDSEGLYFSQVSFTREDGCFGICVPGGFEKEITIEGIIRQILVGHWGNGGDSAIFLLKTDGTVDAIYASYDNEYDIVSARIDGVENIIELYDGDQGGGSEIIGKTSDGQYIGLGFKLQNQITGQ